MDWKIAKRSHALGAPVQSSEFKVQSSEELRNEPNARSAAVPGCGFEHLLSALPTGGETPPQPAGGDARATKNYQTNPMPRRWRFLYSPVRKQTVELTLHFYQTNPSIAAQFDVSSSNQTKPSTEWAKRNSSVLETAVIDCPYSKFAERSHIDVGGTSYTSPYLLNGTAKKTKRTKIEMRP